MKTQKGWAVVYTYVTMGNSREDVMDSWFLSKSPANKRLKEQKDKNPQAAGSFYLCPIVAWQDDEFSHWHIKRDQR